MMFKLGAILWKHFTIRTNTIGGIVLTLYEFLIPIIALLLILSIRNFHKTYVNETNQIEAVSEKELLTRIDIGSTKIFYAPSTAFLNKLVRKAQLKLSLYNEDFYRFPSSDQLIQSYDTHDYDGTTVAILFNDMNNTMPQNLKYEIRIYEKDLLWNTDKLFLEDSSYIPRIGSENYVRRAFAAVQLALDTSFIEIVTGSNLNVTLTFQEFPYPPHLNTDAVAATFRYPLALITLITFISMCLMTLNRIISESCSGMRAVLKLNGVPSVTLWLGWLLNGVAINVLSAIIMAIIFTSKISSHYAAIERCNLVILILFLILYCCASTTFLFAFSTFFRQAKIAMTLATFLWIWTYFGFLSTIDRTFEHTGGFLKFALLLSPVCALHYGYNTISLYELRQDERIEFNNILELPTSNDGSISLGVVMSILLFDTVLYFCLTLLFDSEIWARKMEALKNYVLFRKNLLPDDEGTEYTYSMDSWLETEKNSINLEDVKGRIYTYNPSDTINLVIQPDSITCLLGKNCAGKTTLMNIITGLVRPGKGQVHIDGYSIKKDREKARAKISFCQQANLLYDDLTVKQHMVFFGMLRGMKKEVANEQAMMLLGSLKLADHKTKYASELSSGMKRKLSIGIALMGDREIIILDEPTAGIDAESRLDIWALILFYKAKDKTILISTQVLSEAEHLSDYIVFIDSGSILCNGTPQFLKQQYNGGYKCDISYEDDATLPEIEALLKNYHYIIEGKTISCYIEEDKEYQITRLSQTLNSVAPNSTFQFQITGGLQKVYTELLEKRAEDDNDRKKSERILKAMTPSTSSPGLWTCFDFCLGKRYLFLIRAPWFYISTMLALFLVTFFTFHLGEFVSTSKDGERTLLELSKYGRTNVYYSITGNDEQTTLDEYFKEIVTATGSVPQRVANTTNATIAEGIRNLHYYNKKMIVGAEFTFNDRQLTAANVLYSNKALHGAPISINLVMNSLLKYYTGNEYSISAANTPLQSPKKNRQVVEHNSFLDAARWLVFFPMGPLLFISSFLIFPGIEKGKRIRTFDKLCGVTTGCYWLANFVWDGIYHFVVISILFVGLRCYLYESNSLYFDATGTLYVVFLLYGLMSIPYSYFFSYNRSLQNAHALFIIVNIAIAPAIALILTVSRVSPIVVTIVTFFNPHTYLCYLLPRISFKIIENYNSDILSATQRSRTCAYYDDQSCCGEEEAEECIIHRALVEDSIFYWVPFFIFLFYIITLTYVENIYDNLMAKFAGYLQTKDVNIGSTSNLLFTTVEEPIDRSISKGVFDANLISQTYLTIENWKIKATPVLQDLTLRLTGTTCIGLVSANGTGKTAAMRTLVGELLPTAGTLNISGTMSYCSQENALLEMFSARELLSLYGRLRGQKNLENIVAALSELICVTPKIADYPCSTYSYGGQRLVSVCLALIGVPMWILLDEPTSSIDYITRKKLSNIIKLIKEQGLSTILMTSHNQAICEGLCDAIYTLDKPEINSSEMEEQVEPHDQNYKITIYTVDFESEVALCQVYGSDNEIVSLITRNSIDGELEQNLREKFEDSITEIGSDGHGILHLTVSQCNWLHIFKKMEEIRRTCHIEDYCVLPNQH